MVSPMFLAAGWDAVLDGKWIYARNGRTCIRFARRPQKAFDLWPLFRGHLPVGDTNVLADYQRSLIDVGLMTVDSSARASPAPIQPPVQGWSVRFYTPVSGGLPKLLSLSKRLSPRKTAIFAAVRVGRMVFMALATKPNTLSRLYNLALLESEKCTTFCDVVASRAATRAGMWKGQTGFWTDDEQRQLEVAIQRAQGSRDACLRWTPEINQLQVCTALDNYRAAAVGRVSTTHSVEGVFCSSAMHRTSDFSVRAEDWQPWCTSSSTDKSLAVTKCYMECYERHAATAFWPGDDQMTKASWNELGDDATDPASLVPDEVEVASSLRNVETLWVRGYCWISGVNKLVPLQLVTLRPFPHKHWLPMPRTTTAGVAAHFSREAAIRIATLELIERNALLAAWANQTCLPRVDPHSLEVPARLLARMIAERGYELVVLVFRHLGFAVGLAVAFPVRSVGALYLKGTAARENEGDAVEAALLEMHQSLCYHAETVLPVPSHRGVRTSGDHIAYHSRPDRMIRLKEWLTSGPISLMPKAEPNSFPALLAGACADPIVVDLASTGRAIAVRVIAPGIVPLPYGPIEAGRPPVLQDHSGSCLRPANERDRDRSIHPFG